MVAKLYSQLLFKTLFQHEGQLKACLLTIFGTSAETEVGKLLIYHPVKNNYNRKLRGLLEKTLTSQQTVSVYQKTMGSGCQNTRQKGCMVCKKKNLMFLTDSKIKDLRTRRHMVSIKTDIS